MPRIVGSIALRRRANKRKAGQEAGGRYRNMRQCYLCQPQLIPNVNKWRRKFRGSCHESGLDPAAKLDGHAPPD
jgi:hypothetical protein